MNTDITKLVLKGSSFKEVSIQEIAEQISAKKKCKIKLPTWFNTKYIYYPNKLNIEQTSSEVTANYKANLLNGSSLIDITGGFGIDCFAFSKSFKQVTHCEINLELSEIVKYNYKQIQIKNIKTVFKDGISYLKELNKKFDVIYVDPSRRNDLKNRVFLLEDCLPNLPKNLDLLFSYSDNILVKTAPLLDIDVAVNELKFVKEIHVIAVNNEVKEVLYLLENNYQDRFDFKTINITKDKNQIFNYNLSFEKVNYTLPKKYLYEPNAAILKAGAFSEISIYLKIAKLHKHSHLYSSNRLIDFPGRIFKITQVLPYQPKKIMKALLSNKANITTRNFPESVALIRKKTKLKDGGDTYIFFTTDLHNNKIVLICEKIKSLK